MKAAILLALSTLLVAQEKPQQPKCSPTTQFTGLVARSATGETVALLNGDQISDAKAFEMLVRKLTQHSTPTEQVTIINNMHLPDADSQSLILRVRQYVREDEQHQHESGVAEALLYEHLADFDKFMESLSTADKQDFYSEFGFLRRFKTHIYWPAPIQNKEAHQ